MEIFIKSPFDKLGSNRCSPLAKESKRGLAVLTAIIILNVILFNAGLWSPGLRDSLMLHSSDGPVAPIVTAVLNWRAMASYSFVHSDLSHLLFNMIFLWITGRFLIRKRGLRGMLIPLLVSIVAGGFGFLLATAFMPLQPGTVLCGASAGVTGLCGAGILCRPSRKYTILISLVVASCIVGNLKAVALATHVFGFCAGFITEFLFRPGERRTIRISRNQTICEQSENVEIFRKQGSKNF